MRVLTYRIPWGNAGARATVRRMRQLVRDAEADPWTVHAAYRIVEDTRDPEGMHRLIRAFLAGYVEHYPDPVGHELIRAPRTMLQRIQSQGWAEGDCDDVATLGAALGKALGLPARFVLLSFSPRGPFSHVYTELGTGCCWRELDTSAPAHLPEGLTIHRTETHEA
jgi:transglutaminase-like putative cysteine protease